MAVYVRELKNDVIRFNQKLRISTFIPNGLEEMIKNYVPEHNYILGVCYQNGDSQIGISGHPKTNESITQGFERELLEELCLIYKLNTRHIFKVESNFFYCINIKNCYLGKFPKENKLQDVISRSVICVYGTENDILKYLFKIRKRKRLSDYITCVWASKKNKILDVITKIKADKKQWSIY
jgi:hypothetical protein